MGLAKTITLTCRTISSDRCIDSIPNTLQVDAVYLIGAISNAIQQASMAVNACSVFDNWTHRSRTRRRGNVNGVADRVRAEMYRNIGLFDLLTPVVF
jgi:hypothetical protein